MAGRTAFRTVALRLASAVAAVALQAAISAAPPRLDAPIPGIGAAPQRRSDPAQDLAAGKLLVASRTLNDRNFFQTVVLLIVYNKDGAAGLILNRQTRRTVGDLLPRPEFRDAAAGMAFMGGPVELSSARGLLHTSSARPDLYRVLDDIYLLHSSDELSDGLAHEPRWEWLRVYVGYAGWGSGQLEDEIVGGQWHLFDATADVVFDPNPETLWRRQIRKTETLMAGSGGPVTPLPVLSRAPL